MTLADQRSNAQLANILSAAGAIARGGAGMDPTVLQMMMQQQAEQNRLLLQQMQERHEASMQAMRAELATLRSTLEADDEGEEESSTVGAVARSAASVIPKGASFGEGIKATLLNFAAENPAEVWKLIQSTPAVLEKLLALVQQGQAVAGQVPPPMAQQPAAVLPMARPKAVPVVAPPAPAPAPLNGFNAMSQAAASPAQGGRRAR